MKYYQLSTGNVQALDDEITPPAGATLITAEQFAQIATTPVITPAMAQAALQAAAKAALVASDGVAIRCLKAGVAFPATWQTYVQALRAIANGTDTTSTTLPAAPAYPSGT